MSALSERWGKKYKIVDLIMKFKSLISAGELDRLRKLIGKTEKNLAQVLKLGYSILEDKSLDDFLTFLQKYSNKSREDLLQIYHSNTQSQEDVQPYRDEESRVWLASARKLLVLKTHVLMYENLRILTPQLLIKMHSNTKTTKIHSLF